MGCTGIVLPALLCAVILANGCGSRAKETGATPAPPVESAEAVGKGLKPVPSARQTFGVIWTWKTAVKAETPLKASVTFVLPSGTAPTTVTKVTLVPWMPTMGHGSYTDDQVIKPVADSPGVVDIEGIYFIMGGPWDLGLTADVDGTRDTATIKVSVE